MFFTSSFVNSSDKALSFSESSVAAGKVPEPGIEIGAESTRVFVRGRRPKDVVVVAVGGGGGGEVIGDSGGAPLGENSDSTSKGRVQNEPDRQSKVYLPSRSSKLSSASI